MLFEIDLVYSLIWLANLVRDSPKELATQVIFKN